MGGGHLFEVISDGDCLAGVIFDTQSATVETGANREAFERRLNPLFITMASHRLEGKETVQESPEGSLNLQGASPNYRH